MNEKGFTLLEVLLSVAILAIIAGISLPLYNATVSRNDVTLTVHSTVGLLREASTYARSGASDSQWSVHFQAGSVTLFKGTDYTTRDSSYDEVQSVASNVTISYTGDVVFAKLTGEPVAAASITFTGPEGSNVVGVSTKGVVSY